MSVRTLPGTINVAGMSKVHKSIGKCDVCGVSHASCQVTGLNSVIGVIFEGEENRREDRCIVIFRR